MKAHTWCEWFDFWPIVGVRGDVWPHFSCRTVPEPADGSTESYTAVFEMKTRLKKRPVYLKG